MKKLKRKMLIFNLQKVRLPANMSLTEYTSFYNKLKKKYSKRTGDLRLVYRDMYYSGGYWLVERRMETKEELAKRQAILDRKIAKRQAEMTRARERDKILRAKHRAIEMKAAKERKKLAMEKKVEEVKTMVSILQAAGYSVSSKAVKSANTGR